MITSTVELVVVESTCSKFLGACESYQQCDKDCKAIHSDGTSTCFFHNICQCFYDHGPPKDPSADLRMCTLGFGDCNADCDESCCNERCSKNLKDGIGKCIIPFIGDKACVCNYSPPF